MLTDSRDRLCEGNRAHRLPSLSVKRMREAGMVTERGKQRTGSTQVLAATTWARSLTAFRQYLDARDLTWECWWRRGK